MPQTLAEKFPSRTAIRVKTEGDLVLSKRKFLVPPDFTWGKFLSVLRSRMSSSLSEEEALFMFVNGTIPAMSEMCSLTASQSKLDEKGVLLCVLTRESTFGHSNT